MKDLLLGTDLEASLQLTEQLLDEKVALGDVSSNTLFHVLATLAHVVWEARRLSEEVYCTCNTARTSEAIFADVCKLLEVSQPTCKRLALILVKCPVHSTRVLPQNESKETP